MISVQERSHRPWGETIRSALVVAEFAVLVLVVSVALLTVLYLLALMTL